MTAQADSINTTSRRRFLAIAGGAAVVPQAAFAAAVSTPRGNAPAEAVDASKASPALRAAVIALREAHDALERAKARFVAADAKVAQWSEDNPEPEGRRAHKRWVRKWGEYREAIKLHETWGAQIDAEDKFRDAQMVVARVTPRDDDDLVLKAVVAAVYDKTRLARGTEAIISYSVAWDVFNSRSPA